MLKRRAEAVSTFDVSVVEVDNLYGLQPYLLVIMCAHGKFNPLMKTQKASETNSFHVAWCDRLINKIWTSA